MKEITREEIEKLVKNKKIRNTNEGFVDGRGYPVGFYRTRNKRYIEDRLVKIAKKL